MESGSYGVRNEAAKETTKSATMRHRAATAKRFALKRRQNSW